MARTAEMKLFEFMVLKEDIASVIEYIGKKEIFQFQSDINASKSSEDQKSYLNIDEQLYTELKKAGSFFDLSQMDLNLKEYSVPTEEDRTEASKMIANCNDLMKKSQEAAAEAAKVNDTYKEAMAFSNLQVSYSELDNLSFLSLRVGKLPAGKFEELQSALEGIAVVVALGSDKSHVLVASSRKGRFALDTELKNAGFVPIEIPKDFKGVPENVLEGLKKKKEEVEKYVEEIEIEKRNFAETHKEKLIKLLGSFSMSVQISDITKKLESTELVYRVTGWVPLEESEKLVKDLDEITQSRIAIREYNPLEIPSVVSGKEQVPVKLTHGKFVKSFERMIFSYGSPMYGTIDPTPFVAVFFTILFGIMFGDLGQGLVFVLAGILMAKNIIKVGGWNKFAPIFMAIGITSSFMGLLTGEFFSNETVLEPFSIWVTGFFGNPHYPILKMMPSSDPNSIKTMFGVFGVAVGIGFIINSIGLVINMINNIILKRWDKVLFGKDGLAGTLFFWYVIVLVLRIFLFKHSIAFYDWIIIGITLFFAAFAEPFERAMNNERPLFENGFGTYFISGIVELIEVISGYLSNTVSFVRVGAFALSHAVLDFLVFTLTNMCGGQASIGGILVLIVGNAIIVVLEGMIVAIQVIRLQYYEFFSKFFKETGREFKPFKFEYKIN